MPERTPEGGGPDLAGLRRLSQYAKPPKPERDVNPARILAFVAAAVIVVAGPWLIFTRLGDPGPAVGRRSTTSPSPSVSASPTAAPPILVDAGVYEIVGDVQCVRVRILPGTDQEVLNCIKPGVRLDSDGQVKEADSFAWLHVEDPFRKIDGWIATKYVKRVSGPTASPSATPRS